MTKKEEEDIVKNLLRVDFIDDPALVTDFDRSPVVFPGGELFFYHNIRYNQNNRQPQLPQ